MRYSSITLFFKYFNREPGASALVLGLLAGGMLSIPSGLLVRAQLPLLLDSETVPGTVIARRQAGLPAAGPPLAAVPLLAHGKGGLQYLILYEYADAAGNPHRGESRVPVEEWKAAKPGDAVAVRYVRGDPGRSQLEGSVWDFWPVLIFGAIGLSIWAGSLWCGITAVRRGAEKVRLVQFGQPVIGMIIRLEIAPPAKRRSSVGSTVEYAFETAEIVRRTLELPGRPPPHWQVGGTILILVDPDDPCRHAPDIFDARREDRERLS